MQTLSCFCALLFAASIAVGEDQPDSAWDRANIELPAHIPAPADQLTLYADFEHAHAGGVPVYLVNRTAAPITLKSQDGDLYLKLEFESAPGSWVRAQSHQYSRCGNSYFTRSLEPGRFVVITGYRPKNGEQAQVRYRLYGQDEAVLSSNVGEGLVSPAEIKRAANDAMNVRTGDFEFVRNVALGESKLHTNHRSEALLRLYKGKFDSEQVAKVLEVAAHAPDKEVAYTASQLLHCLKHGEPLKLRDLLQNTP